MIRRKLLFLLVLALFIANARSFVLAEEINAPLTSARSLRTEAVQLARDGETAKALPIMENALRLSNDSPDFSYDYVVLLSWAGKHADAVKKFESLPKNQPIPDYVLPDVAASYRHIGEYDRSIEQYQEYLNHHPKDRIAIEGIVYCYLDTNKTEEALSFVNRLEKEYPDEALLLKLLYADVLFKKGYSKEALRFYAEVFYDAPENAHAQIGMIRALIAQGRSSEIAQCINVIIEKDPSNYEALICKGEILEGEEKYIQAYQHYEKIYALFPGSPVVRGLKYRALMRLGCTSLVKESLEADKEPIDQALKTILSGDEVVTRIRWNEARDASKIAERNKLALHELEENDPGQPYVREALLRNYHDGLEAMRAQDSMKEVIREYKMMQAIGITLPAWTLTQAADAHLYLQQPEEALFLYRKALEQKWDPEGSTRISVYYTLIELGRFREAESILDALDKDTPAQIVSRGVLRDNWVKENIALNRAWNLLYQDRLKEAHKYLLQYLLKAPANTHIRTALAQTYLWRGWPRRALEEFRISHNLDEKDIVTQISKAYSLNENDRGVEARHQATELLALYPTNKHIQQLNRHFKIQDMRLLTVNGEYSSEHNAGNGLSWSARIDQPIFPWRGIFAEYLWRRNHESDNAALIRRFRVGTDWRLTRDWWFTGGLSFDHKGTDLGHFEKITLTANDYWLFSVGYDSFITDLPLRAAADGISADEFALRAQYRASESFIAQLGAAYNTFSDGNDRMAYNASVDTALTTSAYWKTRVSLEGYAETNSNTDVDYFSPESLYSVYAVPMVEHTWFKRYERALVDRLYVGVGTQWQKDYGCNDVWYLRYEIEHRMSDLWSLLLGTRYAQKNYDGEDTNDWTTYFTFKRHF